MNVHIVAQPELSMPLISVIIETFTVSHEYPASEASAQVGKVLAGLRSQTYPRDRTDIIVVLDRTNSGLLHFVQKRWPEAKTALVDDGTYYTMKNLGFDLAVGDVCALIDGDCIPAPNWLENIAGAFRRGADVIAGKTRYRPEHRFAHTFSIFDFGHVQVDRNGKTFAFNLNNSAFRRTAVAQYRLDEGARRNGACVVFWRRLEQAGLDMVYDPGVFVGHGNDFVGAGFWHKHLERGFDWFILLGTLEPGVLDAAPAMRRLGPLAPPAMFAARVWFDFRRLISNRKDLDVRLYALPYYFGASILIRGIEAAGAALAMVKPGYFSRDQFKQNV
jgi:glycosyltransferase involved in cell wall biosynthesis